MVAWEVTRTCNLNCMHCRAGGRRESTKGELTTEESLRFLAKLAGFAPRCTVIVTGGEPLLRKDIFELIGAGTRLGLKFVAATCGEPITPPVLVSLRKAGVRRISISIDGATADTHDRTRGVAGAFDVATNAARLAAAARFPFQVNTVVSKANLHELQPIIDLAVDLGAVAWHPFLFVPTGRGAEMGELTLTPAEYEDVLVWFTQTVDALPLQVRPTCAPQYRRIAGQQDKAKGAPRRRSMRSSGCLGGRSFVFVGYDGTVQACGFLPVAGGNLRETEFDLRPIWNSSPLFEALRDRSRLSGRCGACDNRDTCGGCRARAYAATGDFLAEDPSCSYRVPNQT